MPSGSLNTLIAQFDELLHRLEHARQSVKLKASINVLTNWSSPKKFEKDLLRTYLDLESPSDRSLLNGLYIVAIASFEEYLRQTLINAIQLKLQRSRNFSDQKIELIRRNIRSTSRFILDNESESDYSKIYEACKRLGTCIPESTNLQINESAIAIITKIADLEKFFECLSDIGFKTDWDVLGRDTNMRRCLKTVGQRDTEKELKEAIKTIRQNRNSIAHTGLTSSNISEALFAYHLEILQNVASIIDSRIN